MDALSSLFPANARVLRPRDEDDGTADRGDRGLHRGHGPAGFGMPASFQPNAMENAINRIIEIILKMQDGNEDGTDATSEPVVDEAGGNIISAEGTDGDDTMTFSAIALFSLTARDGNDTLTIKARSATRIETGDGNDSVKIAARFMMDIHGGLGDDTIDMAGRLATGVSGGDGNDTMTIAADTILGAEGGAGNDTMTLAGDRILATGGTGDDSITLDIKGDRPAELGFARGDGHDTIKANGALNIRFTMTRIEFGTASSGGSYGPDDLTISVTSLSVMIRSKDGKDSMQIDFSAGSLKTSTPQWDFSLDRGDWLLKIS